MDEVQVRKAIDQFKASKEFVFINENPNMEQYYDLAIEALEKQIPYKLKYELGFAKCKCGSEFESEGYHGIEYMS
jgi:hypothetical protein